MFSTDEGIADRLCRSRRVVDGLAGSLVQGGDMLRIWGNDVVFSITDGFERARRALVNSHDPVIAALACHESADGSVLAVLADDGEPS